MGVTASAAIRARQHEVAARVERLVADADERAGTGSGRQNEISSAVRAGRAALRKREQVLADLDSASTRVGVALDRLVEAGLRHAEAFQALGLSIGVGRRLLHEAKQHKGSATTTSSTASPTALADPAPTQKPEPNAACAGTPKGID
jgi:hypothetical protein